MKRGAKCYLCQAEQDLTWDHVPPKGFFPEPRPNDLITVACCRSCNTRWSKDDDAVRAFFTLPARRSDAGDWIWDQKVISGTIPHSPAFREYLLRRTSEQLVALGDRMQTEPVFDIPHQRIDPFIIRVTKGLLAHFYPSYDYRDDTFHVRYIEPDESSLDVLRETLSYTQYERRGEGVFRFRHAITEEQKGGFWLLIFYDAVWYMVVHRKEGPTPRHS